LLARFIGILFFCAGCASTPKPLLEYTLALSAIEAAQSVEAVRYAAAYWHQAGEYYRAAEIQYKNKKYKDAKENFELARNFAEKSENLARLKKFKSGDFIP
jgi:hypothetical protein